MNLMGILCTMGLSVIQESLNELLVRMNTTPIGISGNIFSIAKSVGLCCAFGLCAYECYMMMLGRRGMDVMKLVRIWALAFCISNSGLICRMAETPCLALQDVSYGMMNAENKTVAMKQLAVAEAQQEYVKKLRAVIDSVETAEKHEELGDDPSIIDEIKYSVQNIGTSLNNLAMKGAIYTETKISEWANDIIRFIGELIFQCIYYGLLVAMAVFRNVLACFAPLMFAMSLAPPYKAAWSQWLSKFLSVSLWGYLVYLCVFYVDFIIEFALDQDLTAYNALSLPKSVNWEEVGALGMQAIGTTCTYVMSLLAGAKLLSMVPEVSSWLIPGGVSSGAGSAAERVVSGTASSAGRSAANAVGKIMP